jgi:putative ABC transport system permease protein
VLVEGPSIHATIVGIFGFGSANNLLGATLVAFVPEQAQTALKGGGEWDSVSVAADPGVSPTVLRDRIQQVLPSGFEARTGAEQAQANSDDLKKNLSFITVALLIFAGIALFVGAFIIFNTFATLVAQRTRELALLRALGASGAQVRRSVLLEATVFGSIASLVGLGFGYLMAIGLHGAFSAFGATLPSGSLQVVPRTIIVSIVVGLGTTLAASAIPAFRAAGVPPIAALRDPEPGAYRPSGRRTVFGLLVTAAGVALLLLGLFGHPSNAGAIVGFGAAVVFFGVTILSPLFARPVARVLGAPLRTVAGRLARENAMRNPKRTSSTAAALMIGLAMVAFVAIFASSIKASARQTLEQTLKADYIVTTSQFTGFSQDVATQLRATGAFSAVSPIRQGSFGYRGQSQSLQGVDPATLPEVVHVPMSSGSVADLGDGDVLVYSKTASDNHWTVGQSIPVVFASTGAQRLRIVGIYTDNRLLGSFLVSLPTFERNYTQQLDQVVLAKIAPGVSSEQAKRAVQSVTKKFPNVQVQDQAEFRESQASQIDRVLALFIVLLVFSIIIAVFGIMNTLFLSIYERTREIGLLRAVGMARRQVRSMVRWEGTIVAVFGALLGTVVGVFFGWAMVHALKDSGVTIFSVPIGLLVTFVVLAGLAGLLAGLVPAWIAGRRNVLEAIATE